MTFEEFYEENKQLSIDEFLCLIEFERDEESKASERQRIKRVIEGVEGDLQEVQQYTSSKYLKKADKYRTDILILQNKLISI